MLYPKENSRNFASKEQKLQKKLYLSRKNVCEGNIFVPLYIIVFYDNYYPVSMRFFDNVIEIVYTASRVGILQENAGDVLRAGVHFEHVPDFQR